MRESFPLVPLAAGGLTAFALVAAIFLSSDLALAGEPQASEPAAETRTAPCTCPGASNRPQKPKFAELKSSIDDGQALDSSDELAALSSVQHALSSVADGSTYVWHRHNGRLSGLVKATSSFKDADGVICRHIVVMMTTGPKTRKTEGVACRRDNGVWSLEG
jgi:surface antigen